jgi:hypothetical protein
MQRDYALFPPEVQGQIIQWRQKVLNKEITLEEMKAAIATLREQRRSAVSSVAKAGKAPGRKAAPKALVPQRTTSSLLAGFLSKPEEKK